MNAPITNNLGQTFYVVSLWSELALDTVKAHVWAADRWAAAQEAVADYPKGTARVSSVREGAAVELD